MYVDIRIYIPLQVNHSFEPNCRLEHTATPASITPGCEGTSAEGFGRGAPGEVRVRVPDTLYSLYIEYIYIYRV